MKKNLLLLAAALICCLPLSAQQWRWGVEAGINLTHFRIGAPQAAENIGNMKPGGQAGVTVDYEFQSHWMLLSGLTYANTHSHVSLPAGGYHIFNNAEVKLNHFMLPLKVGYNLRIGNNFQLIPSVGVYGMVNFNAGNADLMYNAGNNQQQTVQWKPMDGFTTRVPLYEGNTPTGDEVTASAEAFNRWNFGFIGGLQAVFADHYTLSVSYFQGLTKAQSQCNLRNYGLLLSIGYRF